MRPLLVKLAGVTSCLGCFAFVVQGVATACDVRMQIINQSSYGIRTVSVRPSRPDEEWSPNLWKNDGQQQQPIAWNGSGNWDIAILFTNSDTEELVRNVDVCNKTRLIATEAGKLIPQ